MSAVRPVQVSPTSSLLPLEYPQSVAVFDNYEAAQKAVDFLSDHEFPVENLCIVGTDLKLVERVLGRRAWPQVLAGGAMSGLGTGVLLGLLWGLFMPGMGWGSAMLAGLVMGVIMGVLSAAMAHAAARGQRDFNSVTATVATRYEVLGEHKVVPRAREMLQDMPGFRAQQAQAVTPAATLPPSLRATSATTSPTDAPQQGWTPPRGQAQPPTGTPPAAGTYAQSSWGQGAPASTNVPAPDAAWQRPPAVNPWSAPGSGAGDASAGGERAVGQPASGATAWTPRDRAAESGAAVQPAQQEPAPQEPAPQEPTQQETVQPRPEPIYSPWPDHSGDDPKF